MWIKTDDKANLYVETIPGKAPTLLLVHGWANNLTVWKGIINQVSNRCVAVDIRGHGKSSEGEKMNFPRLTHDVDEVLQETETSTYYLVGHSFGGMIALHHQATNRGSEGMVLIDTTARNIGNKISRGLSESVLTADVVEDALPHSATHAKEQDLDKYLGSDILTFLAGLPDTSIQTVLSAYATMNHNGMVEQSISVPSLALRGTEDYLIPEDHDESLSHVCDRIRFEPVENTGHFPHIQRPAKVASLLRAL